MNILWLSWKDIKHPAAGGAELVLHELSKRLVASGHTVTILTAMYPGAEPEGEMDGIKIIRVGSNRYAHSFLALIYYLRHLRNQFDVVVEAVNTAPYFGVFFNGRAKAVLFYHQLARKVWYFEAPFPVSQIGYWLLEPIATYLLGKSGADTNTISESTKRDLMRFGFQKDRIHIISEGIKLEPLPALEDATKFDQPTVLSFGAIRPM